MKKQNKKKTIITVTVVVLVVVIGLGVWFGVSRGRSEPVKVFAFNYVGMTEYWGDSQESYGPVSTDKIQTVFLSSTQTVTEMKVAQGDMVKKGDVLMTFDTTLSDLQLERKRLEVEKLKLDVPPADLTEWKQVVSRIATRSKTCTIALVGKYVKLHDAYLSVMESLYHAGFENDSQVEIRWVESEDLTDQAACKEAFADVDGIIVPGGFGDRGIEGMIQAAQYARENHVPCFGICLGMQIMVIEFARNVLGYKDANSSEFTPDGAHNVISLMPDQQGNIPKGGTMRLGKYPCTVLPGTKMAECYGESEIWERHRHRYEFNNDFRQEMQDAGLVISGTSPDGHLVETVELPGRDFHLGAQFHPEFKSRPNRAHPLFKGFIAAALRYRAAAQRDMLHL